jgi:RHS repeat-associated protein
MGRRVEKKVYAWDPNAADWEDEPEVVRRFVYADWLVVLELDATDPNDVAVLRKYTWGLDLAGHNGSVNSIDAAGGIGGLLATRDETDPNSPVNYLYFYDANGNVGQALDRSDGTPTARYEYDAYGNTIASAGDYADDNPFRFSTKYYDTETDDPTTSAADGVCYFGYRYYSPRFGRWISRDLLEEIGDCCLYRLVGNAPATRVDALGLESTKNKGTKTCYKYTLRFESRRYDDPQSWRTDMTVELSFCVVRCCKFDKRVCHGRPIISISKGEMTAKYKGLLPGLNLGIFRAGFTWEFWDTSECWPFCVDMSLGRADMDNPFFSVKVLPGETARRTRHIYIFQRNSAGVDVGYKGVGTEGPSITLKEDWAAYVRLEVFQRCCCGAKDFGWEGIMEASRPDVYTGSDRFYPTAADIERERESKQEIDCRSVD